MFHALSQPFVKIKKHNNNMILYAEFLADMEQVEIVPHVKMDKIQLIDVIVTSMRM